MMAETRGVKRRWGFALLIVAGAASACLGACNILGPAAFIAVGPGKAPAAYELADRPAVVFVDDRANAIPLNSQATRRKIADGVTRELLDRELLTKMVAPQDAMAYARRSDREGALLPIGKIGEGVGAEQVIFIEMVTFSGSPDGIQPRMTASMRVRVVDVVNRTRLFPDPATEEQARDVQVVSPAMSLERYRTERGRRELQQVLAALCADKVSKLFYRHTPEELGSRLDG